MYFVYGAHFNPFMPNENFSAVFIIGLEVNRDLGHKIVNIFLSISLNICFGCSKEASP